MLRATLKSLLSRKLRLILSALAVILGVMFVSASYVITDTLKGSFESLFTNAFADTDVEVTAKATTVAEKENQAVPTLSASLVDTVSRVPGVKKVTGGIFADGARLIGKNGKVVTTTGAPRFGNNWVDSSFTELRDGRAPQADNEIAINAALAKEGKVKIGDQVGVLTPQQPKRIFTLVGIFGYSGGKDSMSGAHNITFTTKTAQEVMIGQLDRYTSLTITKASGTTNNKVSQAVQAALGAGYEVRTKAQLEKDMTKEFSDGLGFFNKILLGFAGVAIFVGVFLIINTFSIIVAQRTRELGLLRAIGASRRQMIVSILVEATAIGLVASVLGLVSGIGVGAILGRVVGDLTDISTAGTQVPATAIISAFAVGIPVTLIAALVPAVRASGISPIAAMQEVSAVDRPLTKLTVSGALVASVGVAVLAYGLRESTTDNGILWVGIGALIAFVGASLIAPSLARPFSTIVGKAFVWSVSGKLGDLNSRRNPRRTAITAAALMIGVALVAGMGVLTSSSKKSVEKLTDDEVSIDLVVGGDAFSSTQSYLDQSEYEKITKVKGVKNISAQYSDFVIMTISGSENTELVFSFSDTAAMQELLAIKVVSGHFGKLASDEIAIDDQTAKGKGLKLGDKIAVETSKGGHQTMTIAGIYKKPLTINGWIFGEGSQKNFHNQKPEIVNLGFADGASGSQVRKDIEAILANNPEISVNSMEGLIDQSTKMVDKTMIMIQVLLGLAILIAILGIINTLVLSILERTRELGMLRAIGLRRGQMMRMVTVESIIISVFGAALGIVVGSCLGIALTKALKDQGITTLALPWVDMAMYMGIAIVVGVIAAIIPAIRAAKINVLAAISYE